MNRRAFLVRTGLALGASLLSSKSVEVGPSAASPAPSRSFHTWEAVREQFPLDPRLIHLSGFFLASHPAPVSEAIARHRQALDANPIGYWMDHSEELEAKVLSAAADYLGVEGKDIALTDSTTMGLGLLYGGLTLKPGQEILSTIHDHYSTETSLKFRAERTNSPFRQIPLYRDIHTVSQHEIVEHIVTAVRPATRILAVTWVHSSTGLKLPIRAIADGLASINASRAEDERVLLCVDAVHGLGVETFGLPQLGCDFFVAGTHKWLFGPRGTGLVWGRPEIWPVANPIIPTFNETAYRMWMQDVPVQEVPMGSMMTPGGFHSFEHRWALDEAFRFHAAIGQARVTERIHSLNDRLKKGLAGMPHVMLQTPVSRELSAGIVCFEVNGMPPAKVVEALRSRNIIASVTPYATRYVRLAPGLLNSPEEIDTTLQAIADLRNT